MTESERQANRDTVARSACPRVIITYGTDTMVEMARKLKGIDHKTIVLTGALQPARFTDSDASFNLGMAVAAAQILPPGVYIVANGRIFLPGAVRKNMRLNRFEEIGSNARHE